MMSIRRWKFVAAALLSLATILGGLGLLTQDALAQIVIRGVGGKKAPKANKKEEEKNAKATITVKNFILDAVDVKRTTISISQEKIKDDKKAGKDSADKKAYAEYRPMKMESLQLAKDATILLKGKAAKLADLKAGMRVTVKLGIAIPGKDEDMEGILVREINAE